jgi:hypothetical protein
LVLPMIEVTMYRDGLVSSGIIVIPRLINSINWLKCY